MKTILVKNVIVLAILSVFCLQAVCLIWVKIPDENAPLIHTMFGIVDAWMGNIIQKKVFGPESKSETK